MTAPTWRLAGLPALPVPRHSAFTLHADALAFFVLPAVHPTVDASACAAVLTRQTTYVQVLGCIGEQFTDGEEVCGVAVNVRPRGDRVEIWTRTASNEAAQVCMPSLLAIGAGSAGSLQAQSGFMRSVLLRVPLPCCILSVCSVARPSGQLSQFKSRLR